MIGKAKPMQELYGLLDKIKASESTVLVNGEKAAAEARLTPASLLHGQVALLRRGKKNWHAVRAG
jgi:DNA-binding NtrC family response regulator